MLSVRFRGRLGDAVGRASVAFGVALARGAWVAAAIGAVVVDLAAVVLRRCGVGSHPAPSAGRPEGSAAGTSKPAARRRRYTRDLSVRVSNLEIGQRAVEEVLRMETRLWGIDEIERKEDGRTTLRYVVRIDRAVPPDLVLESLLARGAPHVLGVALN